MAVPSQRKSGQFGGDGHRANKGAFRASGGSVKPPSKGCFGVFALFVAFTTAASYGLFELIA